MRMPTSPSIAWYRTLAFRAVVGAALLIAWLLVGIVVVMRSTGEDLVMRESDRLIEQTGNTAVGELHNRLSEIGAFARSFREAARVVPQDSEAVMKSLPPIINFQGDGAVAGGGLWPEPYAFDPAKERSSFFWGRNAQGKLDFFDDYNKPGPGYHNEEWYVVVRHSQRDRCFWSRSYMDPYSFQPMTTCTIGSFDGDRFVGEITVDLKLEGLAALAEGWRAKTGGYVFILDRNNKFLTFPKVDLVKKVGKDDKGNRTEEFLTARDLASSDARFSPLAQAVDAMNEDILASGRAMPGYSPAAAPAIDEASYQIDRTEADFIASIIPDPLGARTAHSKLYTKVEVPSDLINGSPSLGYVFHVPSSYWKVVVVKPVAEARAVATSITRSLIGYLSGTVLLAVIAAFFALRRQMLQPLARTTQAVQEIGELVAKDQFDRVPSRLPAVQTADEIGLLTRGLNDLSTRVVDAHHRVAQYSAQLEQSNARLEDTVVARTRSLQLVLDSTGDGLVECDLAGVLSGRVSRQAEQWFGPAASGVHLWTYLAGDDAGLSMLLEVGFQSMAEDLLPFELSAEQAPRRIRRGARTFDLSYRQVFEDDRFSRVLVVVQDATERLAAEHAEREARELAAVVSNIMRDPDGFVGFVHETSTLVERVEKRVEPATLARDLHTVKGNSAIFGFAQVASLCHIQESGLVDEPYSAEQGAELGEAWRASVARVDQFIQKEGKARLYLSTDEHERLLRKLDSHTDHRTLRAMVEAWTYEPTARPLSTLGQHARRLAQQLGKDVDVEVHDHALRVLPGALDTFWSSAIHLVRNALDHGVEAPDERVGHGKAARGKLTLRTRLSGDVLTVSLEDDGRGIDWARVEARAAQSGLPHATAADLEQALFSDGFSTRDEVTALSGRGVGLSAVRQAVEQLGGQLRISSQPGRGTTFSFAFKLGQTPATHLAVTQSVFTVPPPARADH